MSRPGSHARRLAACCVVLLAGLAGCTSKVPADDPVSKVRDPALERACTSALPVRDLIETINRNGEFTPDLTAQLTERVTPFAEAAKGSKNVDLRAAGLEATVQAEILNDSTRPEADRLAAYHPLISAVAQAFSVCRMVGVKMPGRAPSAGNMDGMGGM